MTEEEQANKAAQASLELLYNVSRELASALDLKVLLKRVLFLSMRNVGAISGSLIVLDEKGQVVESALITGSRLIGNTTRQLRAMLERGLAGWVARNCRAVLIPDTSQDERWLQRPDDAPERAGPKSAVGAPLLAGDRLVGILTLVHPSPGFFTLEHLALVQAIADQAGIAVLNARLYAESQRQARVMTALAESAAAITGTLRLEDVLRGILAQISNALRVKIVSLALFDQQKRFFVYEASTVEEYRGVIGQELKLDERLSGSILDEARGVILPEARQDSPIYSLLEGGKGRAAEVAYAPIRSRGEVIGILEALDPEGGDFHPDTLLVMTGIGSLAGTAIRHAQLFEELQAAHQRYRELFQDSIDPILITDREGYIIEANQQAEETTGLNRAALVMMQIKDLGVLDLEKVGASFEGLSSGSTISYETTLKGSPARQILVQAYARKVVMDGIPYIQWILRDISERKRLDNLRDDLIAMIYHDIRSPLANVVSSLDMLEVLLKPSQDPTLDSLLAIAMRSTERIQRLTSSLLDINRLEAGQPVGDRLSVSASALCREALEAVSPTFENKGQIVEADIPVDLPLIKVDADMIRRVLINLLENGAKFSPHKSKILFGANRDEDQVIVWVKDSGRGIPAEEKERIFDKYSRLHPEGGPKGTGLGLAFCRLAVEAHGGRIWVESPPEGGACFYVAFQVDGEGK